MRKLVLLVWCVLAMASPARAEMLEDIQHAAFNYLWTEANPANGMVRDRSQSGSPSSIAAVGFALSSICIGIDHGWITRAQGQARVLETLNHFWTAPQGLAGSGTIGYKGFFYHFLHMGDGLRQWEWDTELSTIDTALLLAGVLDCQQYFNTADATDVQIRTLADNIYRRVDWQWARNPTNNAIRHGWKPSTGYLPYDWIGYSEAMIVNILALGSPTFPVTFATWTAWTNGYNFTNPGYGGQSYVVFPPLFGHQYSHCWIDFRNKRDAKMTGYGLDYFENSRRATLAQQAYCIAHPGPAGYSATLWGISAGDGPTGYRARGAPPALNDDGTITPTAVVSSLPFAPEICLPTIRNLYDNYPALWGTYGFLDGFNLSNGWYGPDFLGIDQGPMVLMIENAFNAGVWLRFMQNPYIQAGMNAAGFVATVGVEDAPRVVLAPITSGPNPFQVETRLSFQLPSAGPARLTVHDVTGREVARLVDGWLGAGQHTAILRAEGLANGVYWFRLDAAGMQTKSRGVLMR
jgi:hypothetical protein